jgi:hypothetical protein
MVCSYSSMFFTSFPQRWLNVLWHDIMYFSNCAWRRWLSLWLVLFFTDSFSEIDIVCLAFLTVL